MRNESDFSGLFEWYVMVMVVHGFGSGTGGMVRGDLNRLVVEVVVAHKIFARAP